MSVNINHQLEQVNNLKITPVGTGATVGTAGIVTYYGDGSQLSGVSGGSGIASVAADTTPQLGGTLDTNGNLIQFGDSGSATDDRLQFGASQDLQIYHDGSHNYIETIVSGANLRIKQAGAGGVELYANAPKILFNDINGGTQIDFSIKDESGSFTITDETNSDTVLKYTQNAALELYYNNSKKFETTGAGVTITGIATVGKIVTDPTPISGIATLAVFGESGESSQITIETEGSSGSRLPYVTSTGTLWLSPKNGHVKLSNRSGSLVSLDALAGAAVSMYYNTSKKLETTNTGISVTGNVSATSFTGDGSGLTNITATGSGVGIQSNTSTVGTAQTINFGTNLAATISNGVATITATGGGGGGTATTRSVNSYTATAGQTLFPPSGTVPYTVGYIDVYFNGSKLDSSEFTASNGTTVTLTTGASLNDIVELVAYENVNLSDVTVINDTTPQLGGELDINNHDITGTGNMNITGIATANGGQLQTESEVIALAIALG